MNAKESMKRVRDYLRDQLNSIRHDPYLAAVAPYVEARIERWDERAHEVFVIVRDTRKPITPYNSDYCKCNWIWTESTFYKSEIWMMLNKVVCEMLRDTKIS